jgi:nucleoside-diphosphate-sugar epimerase
LLSLAAAKTSTEQFVFLSTSAVYGNRATNMIDEAGVLVGDDAYSVSKIRCEEHLRVAPPAPSTVVLRPALVFGEGDRGNMIALIRQVLAGKYFNVGDGSALKSLIYSRDLAEAISLVIKAKRAGFAVFNLSNPAPVTIKTITETIRFAGGANKAVLSVPPFMAKIVSTGLHVLLGAGAPLSPQRLVKLTRNNSISVSAFVEEFDFAPAHELLPAIANEISWARVQHIL